jgi:hypothetical protein
LSPLTRSSESLKSESRFADKCQAGWVNRNSGG